MKRITKVVNEQNVTLGIAYNESNSNNNNYDFRDKSWIFSQTPRHFVLQISSLTLTDKKNTIMYTKYLIKHG